MDSTENAHSAMFERLKGMYEKDYITKETLKGWVKLHSVKPAMGIIEEEYTEITEEEYVA